MANEHRYTFGIATVDIDGDGDLDLTYPDIYSAGGQGESNLYWLENKVGHFPASCDSQRQLGLGGTARDR
ncbi:MAG: hypothetical protein Ct9H300mP1_25830 [Planctomycetaceae bacterium]|nr:MAG: hypothetical protein Ct9H300mP1_25830 [Planctomycetaceae bacterium]